MLQKYTKKIITALILIAMVSAFTFPSATQAAAGWYDSTWQYRLPITVNNNQNNLALKNYLLEINLDYTNFDFAKANVSGYDFRFTQDNGVTLLDHNVEYYNYPKSARLQVLIPYAAAKLNSLIYLYYGAKTSVANVAKNLQTGYDVGSNFDVIDSGQYAAPSNWQIVSPNHIRENSNIWSYDAPSMSGTIALFQNLEFTSGDFSFDLMSEDDDGLGFVFAYKDNNNYYRLLWLKSDKKEVTQYSGSKLAAGLYLQKKYQGNWSTLYSSTQTYAQNQWYKFKISLTPEEITVYLDDKKKTIVKDKDLRGPKLGFYSWAENGANFKNFGGLVKYENPNLYFPVTVKLGSEESQKNYTDNLNRLTPSIVIKIAENENINNPAQIYYTKYQTPIFAGLAQHGLKVKLIIDDQIVADLTPKEGEKSGVANWTYWYKPEELTPGEHTVYTLPYRAQTGAPLEPSPKIKFIVQAQAAVSQSRAFAAPLIIRLGENPKIDMTRVYVTHQTQPIITGLSPYGWPVRIYIDNQNIGDAVVKNGETTGTSNWYIKPNLTKSRHILVAVTYNPKTNGESKSPQVITFEVK